MSMTKEEALAFAEENRAIEVIVKDVIPEKALATFYAEGWTAHLTWRKGGVPERKSTIGLVRELLPEYWAKVQEANKALRAATESSQAGGKGDG
jgi:hypothetical protein